VLCEHSGRQRVDRRLWRVYSRPSAPMAALEALSFAEEGHKGTPGDKDGMVE